jgi:hypothetical protein
MEFYLYPQIQYKTGDMKMKKTKEIQYMQIPVRDDTWVKVNSRKQPRESFNDVLVRLFTIVEKYESENLKEV